MPASVDRVAARLRRLRAEVGESSVEVLVVSHPPNLRYLLGVPASAGLFVVGADGVTVVADGRYHDAFREAATDIPDVSTVPVDAGASYEEALAGLIGRLGVSRVGVEAASTTLARASALRRHLPASATLVETEGFVERLRVVKDPFEQAIFREAGARLTAVAACILPRVLAGRQEREVASEIEQAIREGGFERPAFDTIVASGPNAARPHHRAGSRRIDAGDVVVVDFGGMLDGYAVDMTRTIAIGAVSADRRAWLAAVAAAQRAAYRSVRPGALPSAIDAAAREVLDQAGLGERFIHSTGHGLGLEVHEAPTIGPRGDSLGPVAEGMVFTLEPGVYVPGHGGVRIEDDVLVTASGVERLTGAVPGFEAHES